MTEFELLCTLCGRTLDDGRATQAAIDGTAAHVECLDDAERRREEANDEGDE